jgi:hypothetical protein
MARIGGRLWISVFKRIYATGFDAITGSFDRIDIRGVDGRRLKDEWRRGRRPFSVSWSKASPTC